MFGLFKNKQETNYIEAVKTHLEHMGYFLLPYGVSVAKFDLLNGYNAEETASHIAYTTLALDVREAIPDSRAVVQLMIHSHTLLRVLKDFKDRGKITTTLWENDVKAIYCVVQINEHQAGWIEAILSDPIAGKERMAIAHNH